MGQNELEGVRAGLVKTTGFCDMSCVPTAETRGLQEQAEPGRGIKQGSDGRTWHVLAEGYDLMTVNLVGLGLCPLVLVFQVAVEKYEEVLHNLAFARDLHKTLGNLTENVSFWQ